MSSDSRELWVGRPSQVLNAPAFLLCGLFCWLLVPVLYAAWRYLDTRCRTYTLTRETLRMSRGVLSQRVDMLEVFRVKDIAIIKPFWMRMFGLGTIQLTTSDHTHPYVEIEGIAAAENLAAIIRSVVDEARTAKGVREFDHA